MNIDNFETWFGVKKVCDENFKMLVMEYPELKAYFEEAFNERHNFEQSADYSTLVKENEELKAHVEELEEIIDDAQCALNRM